VRARLLAWLPALCLVAGTVGVCAVAAVLVAFVLNS